MINLFELLIILQKQQFGLTTGMAATYAQYNITVNAIGPGFFKTEMTNKMSKAFVFTKLYNTLTPVGWIGKKR